MKPVAEQPSRKRPFNLLLTEGTVKQARGYTSNLSATVDTLLAEYVARRNEERLARQKLGDAVAEAWNEFHAAQGAFADEFSTL